MARGIRISRLRTYTAQLERGVYAFTGYDAGLYYGRRVTIQPMRGQFAWTGYDTNLTRTSYTATLSGNTTGTAGSAITYTVTLSAPANQTFTVTRTVTVNSGSLIAVSNPAPITAGNSSTWFTVTANAGSYSVDFTISPSVTRAGNPISVTVSEASAGFTSFYLTSTAAGTNTLPFSIGLAFPEGEISEGQIQLSNASSYQVVVKRTWNDGSVKHAIASGRASLTQNVTKTISVSSGTTPSGTALTRATLEAAIGTAGQNVISCGAFGSVDLSTILTSGYVRTWLAGPEMIECHYRADVGSSQMSAWFHVRYFADGRRWVRAIVENGYLDNGSGGAWAGSNRSYVPSLTIGGSVVYNNGGASRTHYKWARYSGEGWIGGDAAVTATHDVSYLRQTKLVPNYGWTAPSVSTLNAQIQTYTPMSNGQHNPTMSETGFHEAIGLLPNWEALYISSGDARALRATLANSSHLNSYGICYRSRSTNRPIRLSDFSTWNPGGPYAGGEERSYTQYEWEIAHHSIGGYLAYLLTGDYWHYETLALSASLTYLMNDTSSGLGVNRLLRGQTRASAWSYRTVGMLCAVAPDDDLGGSNLVEDYRTLLANNYSTHLSVINGLGSMVYTGCVYQWGYKNSDWGTVGAIAPWMTDFWVGVNGLISDAQPLADMTTFDTVRDWMYRWIVGRLGVTGDSTQFPFTRAAMYGMEVATSTSGSTWWQSWGEIYYRTYGSYNTSTSNTLQGSSGSDPTLMDEGYWGNLHPAIAYAAEHGAEGAAAAYARLTGATNYASGAATFNDTPVWGVAPRAVPGAVPAWFTSLSSLTWATPVSNWLGASGVKDPLADSTNAGNSGHGSIVTKWTGMGVDQKRRTVYMLRNGGHTDYKGNEVYGLDFGSSSPAWGRLKDASSNPSYTPASGYPYSTHTYFEQAGNAGRWFSMGTNSSGSNGYTAQGECWEFDVDSASWVSRGSIGGAYVGGYQAVYFPRNNELVSVTQGVSSAPVVHLYRLNNGVFTLRTSYTGGSTFDIYQMPAVDTTNHILFVQDTSGTLYSMSLLDVSAGFSTFSASGTANTTPRNMTWHVPSKAFIGWAGSSLRVLRPTVGAGNRYSSGVWSTVAISGSAPADSSEEGMFSKIQLITDMGNGEAMLVVVPRYANPDVYVVRLSGAV